LTAWRNDDTSSIIKTVALVALLANANVLVKEFTLRTDLAADSLGVEVVVLRARETISSVPSSAAEEVIESSQDFRALIDQCLELGARGHW
jgi:hypothetical protein